MWTPPSTRSHSCLGQWVRCRTSQSFPQCRRRRSLGLASVLTGCPDHPSVVDHSTWRLGLRPATPPRVVQKSTRVSSYARRNQAGRAFVPGRFVLVALKLRSVDNSRLIGCRDLAGCLLIRHHSGAPTRTGRIMAKSKKRAKVQKGEKLRRGKSATHGKARKAVQAKTVAKAKPKHAPVKKAARKVKQPVAPAVETVAETVAVEVIEQSVPGVTEVEETRKAS